MDLITVIVPIYKAEKYLNRCINSIVCQTYQNLEIILINDGSPDKCPEICNKWAQKDRRIKVIHQDNKGISAARNVGLANATGQFILMVDSDDYLYVGMVEAMYGALISGEADLAICDFQKGIDNFYNFLYCCESPVEIINGETALYRMYLDDHNALQYVAPWGKLYRKELFDNIQYPEGKIFEDIYVTHQILFRCNKIVVIPQILTYYYQNSESIMNKEFHVGKLDYLPALKQRMLFFQKHQLKNLEEIAYDEYLHALIWEYSRVHDLLKDKNQMKYIALCYRSVYKKGYSNKRYPKENALFLKVFNIEPELIILYWKITAKINKLLGNKYE